MSGDYFFAFMNTAEETTNENDSQGQEFQGPPRPECAKPFIPGLSDESNSIGGNMIGSGKSSERFQKAPRRVSTELFSDCFFLAAQLRTIKAPPH